MRAYAAPFPSALYQAGAKVFPLLVPITPDAPSAAENRRAWQALEQFTRPWLNAFSDRDPITRGGDKRIAARVPGTRGQPHVTVRDAGHFLQEDEGPALAHVVHAFIVATPLAVVAPLARL
jgi:haloalkane dehalogenase